MDGKISLRKGRMTHAPPNIANDAISEVIHRL
jgi:hypothetical protein